MLRKSLFRFAIAMALVLPCQVALGQTEAANESVVIPAEASATDCREAFAYLNALMRAENAYVRRKYESVIEILKPIYDKLHCIDDMNTVIEINLLLGVSYYEIKQKNLSEAFFLNVLRSDPDHVVGSVITLPEGSARYIEELRTAHAAELDDLRAQKSPNTVIESLYVLVEKEHHPYWVNFVPFGAGVLQMHQKPWAIVYASTQLAGITMSVLGGAMVEHYRGDNYLYTPQNYARAKDWQAVQITGIVLGVASYVASVLHALLIHEDDTLIFHSPTQTQPELSHRAAPFLLNDGGGIVYGTIF